MIRHRQTENVRRLKWALQDAKRTGDTVDQQELQTALERAESSLGYIDAGFEELFSMPRPKFR